MFTQFLIIKRIIRSFFLLRAFKLKYNRSSSLDKHSVHFVASIKIVVQPVKHLKLKSLLI